MSSAFPAAALAAEGTVDITVRLERELEDKETLHLFTYAAKAGGFVRTAASRTSAGRARPIPPQKLVPIRRSKSR